MAQPVKKHWHKGYKCTNTSNQTMKPNGICKGDFYQDQVPNFYNKLSLYYLKDICKDSIT